MAESNIHDLALTAAKYEMVLNSDKYKSNVRGYDLMVSDLLKNYLQAKSNIKNTLPKLN